MPSPFLNLIRPALALAAGLLGCAGAAFAQSSPTPEEIYRTLSPSVWLVRTFDADGRALGSGSAVVIDNETLLTNCHVLRQAKRIVVTNDNVQHAARLQYLDIERDLCQITARNMRAPAVTLADSDRLAVGQRVYAIGNPLGIERALSDGLISALHRDEDRREIKLIQTSAPISPGSSGGGLFDGRGRLIGITTLQTREGQNINFAIPINWLRDLPARSDAALRKAPGTVTAAATPALPRASGASPWRPTTDVNDVDAIPVNSTCRDEYRKYVVATGPKAFAVHESGKCAWQRTRTPSRPQISADPDPAIRAMEICVNWYGGGCALYAVDDKVVYKPVR